MSTPVPLTELQQRMTRFRERMDTREPDWECTVIFSNINLYYLTGTMQDGMLLIPRDGEPVFRVRRSYERACDESVFPRIAPMRSFRDATGDMAKMSASIHLETEIVPLALLERFRKHFPVKTILAADSHLAAVRAVKSPYELAKMEAAGKVHQRVFEKRVPELLRAGMSEAEFAALLYPVFIEEGHHGIVRFGMFETEIIIGQIGFGVSSLYPTAFDGPGGSRGLCPAVPLLGSRKKTLQDGDLVFVDTGCGVDGYHTDKTMTYVFGKDLPDEAVAVHRQCVEIQDQMAAMLKPGAIPSEIYQTITESLSPEFRENFMGFGDRRVNFLGHGVGLLIDEQPVIARGFDEPITEGMAFALEPKKGIPGVGMVGIENTFLVTPTGGRCITGSHPGLLPVPFR
ncbi:M24 family metallopeptidase [Methanogenium organophilum]|uniref:Xaa-Pro peptidase family protein n=1 Tax=Methanogenium organophilum TaxID=2199 RepID=A0A9X9T8Y7_METOG|nr:Xaa-Pro peptidase family protein [Methanogenium organophilum]WAI01916.1 Xaa-Pro peptidase family protein [Methanogenium organophilum]